MNSQTNPAKGRSKQKVYLTYIICSNQLPQDDVVMCFIYYSMLSFISKLHKSSIEGQFNNI